jgi:hypothetical protein
MRCSATGTCEVDPASTWTVICSSAVVLPTRTDGVTAWDPPNGEPDPYCQFQVNGSNPMRTATIMNSLTPTWEQSIGSYTGAVLLAANPTWRISVNDDDTPMPPQLICSVSGFAPSDFAAGQVEFRNVQRCTSLQIRLMCGP